MTILIKFEILNGGEEVIIKELKDSFTYEEFNINYEIRFVTNSSYGCNCANFTVETKQSSGIRLFVDYEYSKDNIKGADRILLDESLITVYCGDIKTSDYIQSLSEKEFCIYYGERTDDELKKLAKYKIRLEVLELILKNHKHAENNTSTNSYIVIFNEYEFEDNICISVEQDVNRPNCDEDNTVIQGYIESEYGRDVEYEIIPIDALEKIIL